MALKLLPAEMARDPGRLERFKREAQTIADALAEAHGRGITHRDVKRRPDTQEQLDSAESLDDLEVPSGGIAD